MSAPAPASINRLPVDLRVRIWAYAGGWDPDVPGETIRVDFDSIPEFFGERSMLPVPPETVPLYPSEQPQNDILYTFGMTAEGGRDAERAKVEHVNVEARLEYFKRYPNLLALRGYGQNSFVVPFHPERDTIFMDMTSLFSLFTFVTPMDKDGHIRRHFWGPPSRERRQALIGFDYIENLETPMMDSYVAGMNYLLRRVFTSLEWDQIQPNRSYPDTLEDIDDARLNYVFPTGNGETRPPLHHEAVRLAQEVYVGQAITEDLDVIVASFIDLEQNWFINIYNLVTSIIEGDFGRPGRVTELHYFFRLLNPPSRTSSQSSLSTMLEMPPSPPESRDGEFLDEEWLDGESFEGELLDVESLDGEHLDGEHLEGDSLDGESFDGGSLYGESLDGEPLEEEPLMENLLTDLMAIAERGS